MTLPAWDSLLTRAPRAACDRSYAMQLRSNANDSHRSVTLPALLPPLSLKAAFSAPRQTSPHRPALANLASAATKMKLFAASLVLASLSFGLLVPHSMVPLARQDDNNGIHLAVSPICGPLSGKTSDVNAGIGLSRYKTIVAFGDSYTDGGRQDGGPLPPPIVVPPDPEAGGRSTDGKVWIEDITDDIGATIKDYAQSGACTDLSLWPSNPKKVDFVGQMATFLNQSNNLEPETTLYAIFFGINDYEASKIDGTANLQASAQVILAQIRILASAPTNARSFLVTDVYGRGTHTPEGDAFVQTIFSGLGALHRGENSTGTGERGPKLNVAFAEFSRIWDGVLGPVPGYKAFGYTNTTNCVVTSTTEGMCDDPEHYFYYLGGHPSKETMTIMADYVEEVLERCVV